MTERYIVPKESLELIIEQKTMPSTSTIVILESDVLAIREKLAFFETIAKEHCDLLRSIRYSDNDAGDRDSSRANETIRVITKKLTIK